MLYFTFYLLSDIHQLLINQITTYKVHVTKRVISFKSHYNDYASSAHTHKSLWFRESTSDGLVVLGIPVGKPFGFVAPFFLAYLPTLLNSLHSVCANQITTQSSAVLRAGQGHKGLE